MGEPVRHEMENDLDAWFRVQSIVVLVKLESLLAKHAAFEEFYAKRTAPVSEGR